jgi:hypothetical protein
MIDFPITDARHHPKGWKASRQVRCPRALVGLRCPTILTGYVSACPACAGLTRPRRWLVAGEKTLTAELAHGDLEWFVAECARLGLAVSVRATTDDHVCVEVRRRFTCQA